MPTYYKNKKTGKIEAKYVNCDTNSSIFRNEELYERFESKENIPIKPMKTKEAHIETPQPRKKRFKFW